MGRTIPLVLAIAVSMAPASCEYSGGMPPPGDICATDDDCGELFICVYGACYDPYDSAFQRVSFEVVPPASSRMPTQQIVNFIVSSDTRSDVLLRSVAHVHVAVEDQLGAPVPGLVTAERPSLIPGRPLRSDDRAGADGRAVLDLAVTGGTYTVRVLPDDDELVPFRTSIFASAGLDGPGNETTLQMPGPEELFTVTGRAVATVSETQPLPDLEVKALGAVGDPPSRRVISNVVRTAHPDGAFSISIPNDLTSGIMVRLGPTSENPFFPTVDLVDLNLGGDTDLGLVEVGAVGLPLEVTGTLSGPAGPEGGAAVVFYGDSGAGSYTASTVTEADGAFGLDLLWGHYQVVAAPLESSSAGLVAVEEPAVVDLPPAGTVTFELLAPPRAWLRGTVILYDTSPIANAVIRATRVGDAAEAPGPASSIRTVFETRTDSSGKYELRVDSGRFELAVIPPRDPRAPRRTDVLVIGMTDVEHNIILPAPAPFGGRVLEESGDPVANALVRAYVVLPDGRVVQVGDEVTAADGTFDLVLPEYLPNGE